MNSKLFLTWQDKKSRQWFPVGQLTHDGGVYRFVYLKGAELAKKEAGFQPVVSFPDFRAVYESEELFPLFANRVMPASRPEYRQTIEFLSLPQDSNDPLAFLARSGGAKVTDTFEVFCYPQQNGKGDYELKFFAHGLRYLPPSSLSRIANMSHGDRIYLSHALNNQFEEHALQLCARDNHIVGFCPSYLLDDVNKMRRHEAIEVCVERVNDESAPLQFRLLCSLTFPQMADCQPFTTLSYEPVVSAAIWLANSPELSFA